MQYDSVMINNSSASEAAVSLLLDRGHRRIGFISGPLDRTTGSERMAGYRRALETRGIAVDDDLIRIGDFTSESGNQLALDLLERASMDALYVANTDMAGGAFRALKHNKVRVPDDLALVIFDDPDWATMVAPEITAVRQPVYSIGSTAADLLFKRILEAENYLDKEPVRVTLEATLVERESV
jgi:DNA-binding LacI/PurR family transcriptional regulator